MTRPVGRVGLIIVALAAMAAAACAPRLHGRPTAAGADPGSSGTNAPRHQRAPYVILISLDGYRPDYLEGMPTPALRRLAARGTRARWMTPVFPSKTFPNHYSLVTGLYPEHHGIVGNTFYDPSRRQTFSLSNRDTVSDGAWYRGEPLWVAAEKQGMVAGAFFWPGSEAAIGGVRPTFWKMYDASVPHDTRVDTVLDWLRLPAERRPHFMTLYMSDVDTASHGSGVSTPEVRAAVDRVDAAVGRLLDGIDALAIRDQIYIVLTSDHGMADTSPAHAVDIDRLIDMTDIVAPEGGPIVNLHVAGGVERATVVRDRLNASLVHGRAYLRGEVPDRHHYRADPRIGDVVVIMDEPYLLALPGRTPVRPITATHGWDAALPSMRATFVIAGPGIAAGAEMPDVRAVDVYSLLIELLTLKPTAVIDGRPGAIRELLQAAGSTLRR